MILDSANQYVVHLRESSRVLLELMAGADEETCVAIRTEIARAAAQFMTEDGLTGPGEILIGAAQRP